MNDPIIQTDSDNNDNNIIDKLQDGISLDSTTNRLNGTVKIFNNLKQNLNVYGDMVLSEIVISDENVNNESPNSITNGEHSTKVDNELLLSSNTNQQTLNHNSSNQINDLKLNNNNNPKKYGKFRILVESELNSLSSDHESCIAEASNQQIINGSSELDVTNYVELNIYNEVDISSSVANLNLAESPKNETKVKRRGRPRKNPIPIAVKEQSEKSSDNDAIEQSSASRRRSSRLKKLEEEKKDDNSSDASNLGNSNDSNLNLPECDLKKLNVSDINTEPIAEDTEKLVLNDKKPNKSKSKSKHDSKNEKSKSKHKKERSSKLSKSLNKENKVYSRTKNDESDPANSEWQNENFTPPLPPQTEEIKIPTIDSPSKSEMDDSVIRPEKVKSRWRRNSELESTFTVLANNSSANSSEASRSEDDPDDHKISNFLQNCSNEPCNQKLPEFENISENIVLFERKKSKSKKETKKMVCDCILTKEERARGLMGCGEDCLNRMLMIECGSRCPLSEHCSNKRFTMKQYSKVEPFLTAKKGWGLRAMENLAANSFLMEYVGEVIDPFEFHKRVEKYAKQKLEHHYFMALKSDEIIDATCKGNITRFVNHSCEPNSETQKWTVNGELRIGFFTFKQVNAGEEITFDYQFQRYGKKAQKCYCESENCRGYIGSESASEKPSILTDGSKIPKNIKRREVLDSEEEEFIDADAGLEDEIEELAKHGGLRNRHQILVVSRLMLRAEDFYLRLRLIDVIMSTIEMAYLRLFIDYHGLQLIWSWMVEAENIELKSRLLELLEILPIPNKTMLIDCKVYSVVERWAHKDSPESQQFIESTDDSKQSEKTRPETQLDTVSSDKCDVSDVDNDATKESLTTENVNDAITEINTEQLKEDSNETIKVETELEVKKTNLSKLSGKVVIKSKSKANNENVAASKNKSNITIGYLAQKLLIHWKDLKEVFRIPRLERQKRHDDEAEADRRTKEEEERRAHSALSEKRSIDDKDYSVTGIFENKKRCLKSLHDANKPQFLINNTSTNNSNANGLKLSKEEHRKIFEYNVAHSDYADALKKYQENLAIYNATYRSQFAQQQQMLQQLHAQKVQQGESAVASTSTTTTPTTGFSEFYQYSSDANTYIEPYSNQNSTNSFVDKSEVSSNSYYNEVTSEYANMLNNVDLYPEIDLKDLVPKYSSPLVTVSKHFIDQSTNDFKLSSYAIDNVDFTQIRYDSDDFIESMEKKMFDEMYPPPGIFYITQKGATYFLSFPDDLSQVVNVKENVTEPLPLSFTEKLPDTALSCSWKYSSVDGHIYYYNKRKQIKQWHPPQDSQIDHFDDNQRIEVFDVASEFNNTSINSSPVNHKDKDSDISHDEVNESKRKSSRRIQEHFRYKISQYVVKCLNPYMRSDCKKARITNSGDFKYLARKLTHTVVEKETKQCKHVEDLAYTEPVKHKTKEYVKRYMSRYGVYYKADSLDKSSHSP